MKVLILTNQRRIDKTVTGRRGERTEEDLLATLVRDSISSDSVAKTVFVGQLALFRSSPTTRFHSFVQTPRHFRHPILCCESLT